MLAEKLLANRRFPGDLLGQLSRVVKFDVDEYQKETMSRLDTLIELIRTTKK